MFREPSPFISRCGTNKFCTKVFVCEKAEKKIIKERNIRKKYTVPGMFTSLFLQDVPAQVLLFVDALLSGHLNQYF